MKTAKIITISLLTVLATACGKETDGLLRIYANHMNGGGSKVWVNPENVSSSASWVTAEQIDLNGTPYPIAYDEGYYINTGDAELSSTLYAIYPASVNANGNDLSVANNGASASTVIIRSLAVNFRSVGDVEGHDIVFPMAATAVAGEGKLFFNHLTGGLKLKLTNTSPNQDYTLGSVKVVVYGEDAAPTPLTAHNVTTSWEIQGPTLPSGEIGEIAGDQSVCYASEMHFSMKTNGEAGKEIAHGNRITFCVPVTVSPVKKLVVTGYGTDGAQLFVRFKELGTAQAIMANYMYNIPEIEF